MAEEFSGTGSAVLTARLAGISSASGAPRLYPSIKRVLDVTITLLLAPIAITIICIVAIALRRDGGSAFYSQKRVGLHGREFTFWKLRTMVPDAAARLDDHLNADLGARAEWEATQKLKSDPRVTRLGRYLRKYSLDELPQLFNVLVGDMSLVGPRPIMPSQREQYVGTAYFDLRPGLTGLWQVGDRNACTFAERASRDTQYAAMMSFSTDLRILLVTPMAVMRGTGF